jgi:putative ABC transport system substrate-binding protein
MTKLHRSISISLIVLALISACGQAPSTPTVRKYTIAIINATPALQSVVDSFVSGLANMGYKDGQNVTYLHPEPIAEGEIQSATQALVAQEPDLIFALTNISTEASLAATKTIPIVCLATGVVELHYVKTLAAPGGNMTCVDIGPTTSRRLQVLLEMFPNLHKVYVPDEEGYITAENALKDLRAAAGQSGIELVVVPEKTDDDVKAAIQNMPADIDAIFTLPDPLDGPFTPQFSELAIQRGIPFSGNGSVEQGPIMTYGQDTVANGQLLSHLADQVFKGATVGDLPVELGEFTLAVNLKTANAAHLEISDAILQRANQIVRESSS